MSNNSPQNPSSHALKSLAATTPGVTGALGLGLVGLGRMGANMARRLARHGIVATLHDQDAELTRAVASELGTTGADSLHTLVDQMPSGPRVVWLMLPAGAATQQAIDELPPVLRAGDLVVDGANSDYRDAAERSRMLAGRGIHFADVGVSGGVHGLANGYCLMAGCGEGALELLRPILQALAPAPDTGWLHAGPVGAGHFVKMVHNGIEYGMMQALAEGFSLMAAKKEFSLDLAAVGELWRHGSVVRSWLLDLTAQALHQDASLAGIKPHVADSGEGRWTAREAVDLGVPTPVMSLALMMRFASQGQDEFGSKLLAKMRQGFGGHAVQKQ